MTEQPPSFTPKNRAARPSDAGAHAVGSGAVPEPSAAQAGTPSATAAPMRRRSVMPTSSASASSSASAHSRAALKPSRSSSPAAYAPEADGNARPASYPPAAASASRPHVHVSRERSAAQPAPASSSALAAQAQGAQGAPAYARSSLPSKVSTSLSSVPRPHMPRGRIIALLLILALAWPAYLYIYGSAKLEHVEALSGAANTPGDTWLLVGSDKREEGVLDDGWEGERTDTIMLMQIPESGRTSLVSIPRDTLVNIEGYGPAKINASYSYGGAPLLVQTVEELTGMTVDHYVEVSMGGLQNLVDAVGGVNVCYDADVSDRDSGMEWTAGCHDVNGSEALSFARMRYADPLGDIGRNARQRQILKKVISKAASPGTLVRPLRQRALVGTAATNLETDSGTGIGSLARAGIAMRSVMSDDGLLGHPPIENLGYWYAGQACVLLDQNQYEDFFAHMRDGTLTPDELNVMPTG